METAIRTESLEKIYKPKEKTFAPPVHALKNLTLSVNIGDIYGFIGPNGAGKTTALKILMGLISPSSGTAYIMEDEAGSVSAKKKIGFLSEVSYYYPFMEVGRLLDFYCSFYEIPRQERKNRINKVLGMVNLSDKIHARMNELSKGMQQRFGIAQAIIADPPILILDELTSGLDPIAQKEVKDIVLELKKQGKTIFFSSHQMTEVENICDRIGIIHKGVLRKTASLDEFLKEESDGLSRVVFEADSKEAAEGPGREIKEIRPGTYSLTVPSAEINGILDAIRNEKGRIIEISPHIYSLEDAFFRLIKEDEAQ